MHAAVRPTDPAEMSERCQSQTPPGRQRVGHNGQARVIGKYVPHFRNSQREALRVSRMLGGEADFPVPTISCLAFRRRDGKLTIKESPADAPKHYMQVTISKAS